MENLSDITPMSNLAIIESANYFSRDEQVEQQVKRMRADKIKNYSKNEQKKTGSKNEEMKE